MMNTLDWDAMRRFVAERRPVSVDAGLLEDWYWTAAAVYEGGQWDAEADPYVTSYWATPGFKATMPNGDVVEVAASRPQTEDEAKQQAIKREARRAALREWLDEQRAARNSNPQGD